MAERNDMPLTCPEGHPLVWLTLELPLMKHTASCDCAAHGKCYTLTEGSTELKWAPAAPALEDAAIRLGDELAIVRLRLADHIKKYNTEHEAHLRTQASLNDLADAVTGFMLRVQREKQRAMAAAAGFDAIESPMASPAPKAQHHEHGVDDWQFCEMTNEYIEKHGRCPWCERSPFINGAGMRVMNHEPGCSYISASNRAHGLDSDGS